MASLDDDALRWEGDEDRLTTGAPESPARRTSKTKEESSDSESTEKTGLSSLALVSMGVFAGIYLLFTVAWLITALRNPTAIADVLGNTMFQLGMWLTVLAPALWFIAVAVIWKNMGVLKQMLWLTVGVVALIPWPYISWAG
jgi:hypothetical protein